MTAVMARTRMFPTAVAPVGCATRGVPACAELPSQGYRLCLFVCRGGSDLDAHHECGWILRVDPQEQAGSPCRDWGGPEPSADEYGVVWCLGGHGGKAELSASPVYRVGQALSEADINSGWCGCLETCAGYDRRWCPMRISAVRCFEVQGPAEIPAQEERQVGMLDIYPHLL